MSDLDDLWNELSHLAAPDLVNIDPVLARQLQISKLLCECRQYHLSNLRRQVLFLPVVFFLYYLLCMFLVCRHP